MKKIILSIAALFLMGGIAAQAQTEFNFGVKGGAAINWMPRTTLDPDDKASPNFGFYGGATCAMTMSDMAFIQAEVLYSRKGVSTKGQIFDNKYERRLHYLQVPVLLGMKMGDERFRVMVGPEFGCCLGTQVISDAKEIYDPAQADSYNKFFFGLVLQTSYLVVGGLGVDVKVDYGLTKALKNDQGRCLSVQLGLSYTFGVD